MNFHGRNNEIFCDEFIISFLKFFNEQDQTDPSQKTRIRFKITLNPKISQYKLKNKVYPKGRSTMGMPGTKPKKAIKKWKPKR